MAKSNRFRIQHGVFGIVTALLLQAGVGLPAFAQEVHRFQINTTDAATAIHEFGNQSGVQILASAEALRGKRLNEVSGDLSTDDGLQRLLADTGLSHRYVGERAVALVSDSPMAGSDSSRAPSAPHAFNNPDPGTAGTGKKLEEKGFWSRFRLAQVDQGKDSGSSAVNVPSSDSEASSKKPVQLEEIVVTGTHIRNIDNRTAPTLTIDRATIDRTGYSSTQQLIDSLPQNFGGGNAGASEDGLLGAGADVQSNISGASGINLRGLGTTSTLVLINGHRVAPASYGRAVDVSLIPLGAIERVEVLTDGSSAIYGSDAVAGVVNFVLRKDYEGAETRLRSGRVTEGSLEEWLASQDVGLNWDSGGLLLSGQYRKRDNLSAADRDFSAGALQPNDLLPESEQYSVVANLHQRFSTAVDAFTDVLFSHKNSQRSFSEPGRTQIYHPKTDNLTASGGIGYEKGSWRLETSLAYSNEQTDFYPSYSPPRPTQPNGARSLDNGFEVMLAEVKADGAVFQLPAGMLRAAVGTAYRDEDFSSVLLFPTPEDRTFRRNVSAAFGEIYVPLIGADNRRAGFERLDLSAAVRYEDYSDFGGTTDPRVGVLWSPLRNLSLRGSYSTSFRAPVAWEHMATSNAQMIVLLPGFLLPQPGGATDPVLLLCCSKEALGPETSTNYAFGLDYTPQSLPKTKFSVNYYKIDFRDRIIKPSFDASALLRPDVYGSLVTRFANDAETQAFVDGLLASGYDFFDPVGLGTGTAGVRFASDNRQQNVAFAKQEGFDLGIEHGFSIAANAFNLRLNATYIKQILTAFSDTSTPVDNADTYANPLTLRVRTDFAWTRANWTVNLAMNYADAYTDTTVVPAGRIDSWTTVDLNASFSPPALPGLSLRLGVQNAFDADPPAVAADLNLIGYDASNADPLGRFISLELRKVWGQR